MKHCRAAPAAALAAALFASACSGAPEAAPSAWDVESEAAAALDGDAPVLEGITRRVADGQRRIDTEIDPTQLAAPPPPEPTLGTMTLPCDPGDGTPSPSDAPGVTDSTITIATGSDRGGLFTAGSARGASDAVRAIADRCNALGGIDGRQIVVVELDAAVVEVVERMTEACGAFSIVGQGFLLDVLAEPTRVECGLPSFPAWTTVRPSPSALVAAAVPSQPASVTLDALLQAASATADDRDMVALFVPDTPGGLDTADRFRRAVALTDLELAVEVFTYSLTTDTDWDDLAAEAEQSGASIAVVSGACRSTLMPFAQAVDAARWEPTVITGPEGHDPACVATWPDLLDGMLVELPIEAASGDESESEALADVLWVLESSAVDPTADAIRAASAVWLWATAADACRRELTQRCVLGHVAGIKQWTAGGLHSATTPSDPTSGQACTMVLAVDEGRYQPLIPGRADDGPCPSQLVVDIG